MIQGALSWATAKRPDKLLIIVSNFLSNSTKEYLTDYIEGNKPSFKIKHWEKPDLERLSLGKPALPMKYGLIEPDQAKISEFTRTFALFNRVLYIALSAVINYGVPQSVEKMWEMLQVELMGVAAQYNKLVEDCVLENHRIGLNMPLSRTPEELVAMAKELTKVSECISRCIKNIIRRFNAVAIQNSFSFVDTDHKRYSYSPSADHWRCATPCHCHTVTLVATSLQSSLGTVGLTVV